MFLFPVGFSCHARIVGAASKQPSKLVKSTQNDAYPSGSEAIKEAKKKEHGIN
jgi:hypothetical protein